jgi:hypothetical protein
MREPCCPALTFQKPSVKRRKQPGLNFTGIAQLVAFGGPGQERFLDQVTGIAFCAGQAHRKPIQRTVVQVHHDLEVREAVRAVMIV